MRVKEKKKRERYTVEKITNLCVHFCETKGGILNQRISVSTIEILNNDRDAAIRELRDLIKRYGNRHDQRMLALIECRL